MRLSVVLCCFSSLAFISCVTATPSSASSLEAVGGKVYTGPDGQKVEMAMLKPVNGKKDVLLRITNTGSEWDGKIMRHEVKEYDGKVDIKTTRNGKAWVTIAGRNAGGWWWSSNIKEYELYVPGVNDDISITYDGSAKFDPKALASQYDAAQDPGVAAVKASAANKSKKK